MSIRRDLLMRSALLRVPDVLEMRPTSLPTPAAAATMPQPMPAARRNTPARRPRTRPTGQAPATAN